MGGGTLIDNSWWRSEAFVDVLHSAATSNISIIESKGKSIQAEAYRALMAANRPGDLAKLILTQILTHSEKAEGNDEGGEANISLSRVGSSTNLVQRMGYLQPRRRDE